MKNKAASALGRQRWKKLRETKSKQELSEYMRSLIKKRWAKRKLAPSTAPNDTT